MKHTKGEWKVQENKYFFEVLSDNGEGKRFAVNCFLFDLKNEDGYRASLGEENEANAKLIAAAPDMLEALKTSLIMLRNSKVAGLKPNGIITQVEKAIEKATK